MSTHSQQHIRQSAKLSNLHTFHSRFTPKGVAGAYHIYIRNAHVLLKVLCYEEYCSRDMW
jgi:hypothetical protein